MSMGCAKKSFYSLGLGFIYLILEGLFRFSCNFCLGIAFGYSLWTKVTRDTVHRLAKEGKKRLLIFSPAFVADCLETIYELGVEVKSEFLALGGEALDYVPSLNDHPLWIKGLARLARR